MKTIQDFEFNWIIKNVEVLALRSNALKRGVNGVLGGSRSRSGSGSGSGREGGGTWGTETRDSERYFEHEKYEGRKFALRSPKIRDITGRLWWLALDYRGVEDRHENGDDDFVLNLCCDGKAGRSRQLSTAGKREVLSHFSFTTELSRPVVCVDAVVSRIESPTLEIGTRRSWGVAFRLARQENVKNDANFKGATGSAKAEAASMLATDLQIVFACSLMQRPQDSFYHAQYRHAAHSARQDHPFEQTGFPHLSQVDRDRDYDLTFFRADIEANAQILDTAHRLRPRSNLSPLPSTLPPSTFSRTTISDNYDEAQSGNGTYTNDRDTYEQRNGGTMEKMDKKTEETREHSRVEASEEVGGTFREDEADRCILLTRTAVELGAGFAEMEETTVRREIDGEPEAIEGPAGHRPSPTERVADGSPGLGSLDSGGCSLQETWGPSEPNVTPNVTTLQERGGGKASISTPRKFRWRRQVLYLDTACDESKSLP